MASPADIESMVTIRPMRDADREAVIGLIRQLNRYEAELGSHGKSFALDRDASHAAAIATLDDDLERVATSDGALRVAECDGKVVGFLCWLVEEAPPYVRVEMRRHGYVVDLVVDNLHRRQGIGQRLLAEAESLTRDRKLRHLSIGVLTGNVDALGAYRRYGFTPSSLEMLKALD
ncbi:Ribosomal protein S18 acetylase RimI [Rhizobiales bacterium GAS191]|nr:Ribosomal protein S18 acetylase RimI [Rhizobiales bacterium GAS188]SEE88317.1 Ribosomal protein S18 acetylase RimI [Rhizobiales bacterium GAS191]